MNESASKVLYYILIYTHLGNDLYLWGFTVKIHLNKLYMLGKKTVRCIANAGMLEHILPRFQNLMLHH